jgi:glucose-1-phosphate cytidylyltransferase
VKALLLAGGRGTRIAEETSIRPKPMVEVGGRPILWHIMQTYAAAGNTDFVVLLGYLGDVIKQYFLDQHAISSDLSIDLSTGGRVVHRPKEAPDWHIDLIDTGIDTMTGGRVKRASSWLGDDDTFLLTYGDGVADLDIAKVVDFHRAHGRLATVTAVRPPARFGGLGLDGDAVVRFAEKPQTDGGWINGGYFVLDRRVLDYIDGDDTIFERQPLERLAAEGELMAYKHDGFWQPMDTLRERQLLESLWASGDAPWKIRNDR